MGENEERELEMLGAIASLLESINTRLSILMFQDQYYHHDLTYEEFEKTMVQLRQDSDKNFKEINNIMTGLGES